LRNPERIHDGPRAPSHDARASFAPDPDRMKNFMSARE